MFSQNVNQFDISNPPVDMSINEQSYEKKRERNISVIPLKSIWYSVGFIARSSLALNLNGTARGYYVHLFFSFSFSSSTSPVNYRRQIRAILPKRMTCTGDGWGSVSSNSFGKASSSVKIKGTVERFTAGRFEEEEATCVQSYHLRRGRNLLATFSSPPTTTFYDCNRARITQIKRAPL